MPARTASACALLLTIAGAAAQDTPRAPVLRAVCAGDLGGADAAGLQWLAQRCLPGQEAWPVGLRAGTPVRVELGPDGLHVAPADAPPPHGAAMAGSVQLPDGRELLWSCAADGTEDWWLPRSTNVPAPWLQLLEKLAADALDAPRRIDFAVLVGHLTTGAADGDPRAGLLHLGAAACGDVTWTAWTTAEHLRVRGRSGGGLMLPAVLVQLALDGAPSRITHLPLRAFTARDGDRDEATRQLARAPQARAVQTLRALLHGDDTQRLVAIDALVRRGETAELPRIVAAAAPDKPLTTLAAYDAVRAMFAAADPFARQRTRAAIARSQDAQLRSLDVDGLLGARRYAARLDDGSDRARALVILCIFGLGLFCLWSRERQRRRVAESV